MGIRSGDNEAPHHGKLQRALYAQISSLRSPVPVVWSLVVSVARHPWTRVVILVLLSVLQMVLLWLLGELVDLSISLMELWTELAAKHLEITLDTTT